MRKVKYDFDSMNDFWQHDLDDMCANTHKAYNGCQTNTVITNNDQCLRLSLYNYFQMTKTQWAYGWMSYDKNASSKFHAYCSKKVSGWKLSYSGFQEGLKFNFGTQSCDGKMW